jgi:hypothetical protein
LPKDFDVKSFITYAKFEFPYPPVNIKSDLKLLLKDIYFFVFNLKGSSTN